MALDSGRSNRNIGGGASSAGKASFLAALAFIALFPLGLFATEGDKGIVKDLGGKSVELIFGSSGAKVGANAVMVRIHDAQGKPVTDATLKLSIAMDQGSTMTMNMDNEKPKTLELAPDSMEAGMYKGSVELGFTGKWIASLDLSRGGQTEMASFNFEVAEAGPNWVILIGFGLVFALIIVAALVLRSKKPKAGAGSAA